MKTTILWDHDGVLVDTEPLYYEATRRMIAELGIDLPLPAYLRNMASGLSSWELAQRNGHSAERVSACRAERDALYQRLLVTRDIAIAGVEATLEVLAQTYRMAIVTTAKREDFELIHQDAKLTRFMRFVLANGDYARSKPHPDPYLAALDRFGATVAETIVVEDSERGLRAAVAAGIDCVVVHNAFVQGQDLSAATYRIGRVDELPALLSGL